MAIQGDKVGLYLANRDIAIPQCNIVITQPTIKDVLTFGEEKFLNCVQLLGHLDKVLQPVQRELANVNMPEVTPLALLLVAYHEEREVRQQVDDFFELICFNYKVKITENSIDFKQEDRKVGMLTPFNYNFFSNTLCDLYEPAVLKNENYNPKSKKAKEIAEKLQKGKEKKAQLQGKSDVVQSLFGTYASILSIGMPMDINVLMQYTPFQMFDAFDRFTLKEGEDYYKLLSSSGFLDTSKIDQPEPWLKNLYE